MDFALSAPHDEIRRTVRDFAEREIAPVADEMERRGEFPTRDHPQGGGARPAGRSVPEEVGGTGLDTLAYAITVEELSRVSGSVGIIVSAHTSLGCAPLFTSGTAGAAGALPAPAGQRREARRLRPHRAGRRAPTRAGRGPGRIATATRGSSTAASASSPTPAWRTSTSSPPSRIANTDSGKISAFIVEAGTPGFSIGRMEEKMGLHASNTGELLFEDCRIPAENLLGEEGDGDRLFLKTLDGGRIGIGAMALGLAQAAYEAASAYAKEREQFGRPIASFQGVAFKIADMAAQIDAARLMVYRAAWLKDSGQPYSTEAAMAKLFASEVAKRGHQRRGPGARRVRLRHRVQRRALPARREADRDRRGDQRDPAHGHRPQPARRARDVTGPIFGTDTAAAAWRPTPAYLERSRLARFLRAHRLADLEALQARAVADPAWFWDAAVRDIGVRFDPEPGTVLDTTRGHRVGALVQRGGLQLRPDGGRRARRRPTR